jgi:tRNA threonylcarbamoyl adenosine modification protein YjeE
MEKTIISEDENDTAQIAARLAKRALPVDCITLSGDLGSGKTTFARAFIQALVGPVNVQSPTFLLVIPYEYTRNPHTYTLQHFDLYRLKTSEELVEIGLEDALNNCLCLIEWPEIAADHLPESRLDISITALTNNKRELKIIAKGDWQERLNSIYF